MPSIRTLCSALAIVGLAACGSGTKSLPPPAVGMQLASTDVTVQSGKELYSCWAFPVTSNVSVIQIEQQIPTTGVHHYAVFTSTDPYKGPAPFECSNMGATWGLVTGGGIGTPGVQFPTGVALTLNATEGQQGSQVQQVILQLHLLNATQQAMTVPPAYVNLVATNDTTHLQQAGLLIAGTLNINIPAASTGVQVQGGCAPGFPMQNIFAVFPHMHTLGSRITVQIQPDGGTPTTLVDKSWNFGEQGLTSVQGSAGPNDQVTVTCTYNNPSSNPVGFGLSTTDEMCFGVLYYYPASTPSQYCGFP